MPRLEISIHALRVEGDLAQASRSSRVAFQSTPSVWRATDMRSAGVTHAEFQSTPSVWRATPRRGR